MPSKGTQVYVISEHVNFVGFINNNLYVVGQFDFVNALLTIDND